MVQTAAHLTDHVFPRLPVRQWVLSVPKRLRYFIQRDRVVLNMVLRTFLRVIAQSLQSNSCGAVNVDKATLHIGAVAFIHRFGSSLNEHVHLHVCVVDELQLTPLGQATPLAPEPAPPKRAPAHYLWAVLIAKIYEVFPLLCPLCGGGRCA
jgi:Putative transposase